LADKWCHDPLCCTRSTFPSDYPAGANPHVNFTGEEYRNITNPIYLENLRNYAHWANIKLVDTIWPQGSQYEICGIAGPGASLVFESFRLCGFLAMHEYGHLTGLHHRDEPGGGNPGADPLAIMQPGGDEVGGPWPPTAVEVNRHERTLYGAYDPGEPWNN
jgi:hypothetical protein